MRPFLKNSQPYLVVVVLVVSEVAFSSLCFFTWCLPFLLSSFLVLMSEEVVAAGVAAALEASATTCLCVAGAAVMVVLLLALAAVEAAVLVSAAKATEDNTPAKATTANFLTILIFRLLKVYN